MANLTGLATDEATKDLTTLCTSLSRICGTADLIETHEQAERMISEALFGSETKRCQRRWDKLGQSAMKYTDLVQRAASSAIATKNSAASLGTELARLEEAVQQRDSDICSVAVENIVDIAQFAYEHACSQQRALQDFLNRLEGELAENENELRRKKPKAKMLGLLANRKRALATGGGAVSGVAAASLVALAATPQVAALVAGTATLSVVLVGAGPLVWITVGAGVASVSLFGVALIATVTGLKVKALKKRIRELLSIVEINRYFVNQTGQHVALWDSIVTTATTARQKSGDLQRLFKYPDATLRDVARTLEATKRGFNTVTRSLNAYILYLLDNRLLAPSLEPLDAEESAIARADLNDRARAREQQPQLVGHATST